MYEIILKSIDRNIACVKAAVTDVDRPLHTFVFYPKVLGHFISYVYPATSADDGKCAHIEIMILLIFRNILRSSGFQSCIHFDRQRSNR